MTLTKYIEELQKLEAAGYGEFKLVYASDGEGNSFHTVGYGPSLGFFNKDEYSFVGEEQFEECEVEEKPNAICVN